MLVCLGNLSVMSGYNAPTNTHFVGKSSVSLFTKTLYMASVLKDVCFNNFGHNPANIYICTELEA